MTDGILIATLLFLTAGCFATAGFVVGFQKKAN